MAFQKFSADQLFDGYRFRDAGDVLIMNEDGRVEDLVPAGNAGDGVRKIDGILSPGLINAHCHLELSHMKGLIPRGEGLIAFVGNVMKHRHLAEELVLDAITNAEDEMIGNGIVATGDICNTPFTIAQKSKGRMAYRNFIEVTGFDPQSANARFDAARQTWEKFRAIDDDTRQSSIVPHAPYSVSEKLFHRIAAFPGNEVVSMHNQEAAAENAFFIDGTGEFNELYKQLKLDLSFYQPSAKSSLQTTWPHLAAFNNLVLVHNVFTSPEDIAFINQQRGAHPQGSLAWCFCPNANQYITGMLPRADLFMGSPGMGGGKTDRIPGQNIVIGTDSLASNHGLNIVSELRTIQQAFPHLDTATLLTWATSNGAKALSFESWLGTFEKGKSPGIMQTDAAFSRALLIVPAGKPSR